MEHPWHERGRHEGWTLEHYVELFGEYEIAFNTLTWRLSAPDFLVAAETPHWWSLRPSIGPSDVRTAISRIRDRIIHFGIFEEMAASTAYFRALIDLPPNCELPRENVSRSRTELTAMSGALYARIVERNIFDMELYYWAVDEFRRRITTSSLSPAMRFPDSTACVKNQP